MARSRVRKPLTEQQKADRIAEKHKEAERLLREICTDHVFEEDDVDDDFDSFPFDRLDQKQANEKLQSAMRSIRDALGQRNVGEGPSENKRPKLESDAKVQELKEALKLVVDGSPNIEKLVAEAVNLIWVGKVISNWQVSAQDLLDEL